MKAMRDFSPMKLAKKFKLVTLSIIQFKFSIRHFGSTQTNIATINCDKKTPQLAKMPSRVE